MTSTANSSPWNGFRTIDEGLKTRTRIHGRRGLTMVIDTGMGANLTNDILEVSGAHIDHWKLGFGTSAVMSERLLRWKLELMQSHGILTYPGGTLLEAAVLHDSGAAFFKRARNLGFRAVEISDGTVPLKRELRRSLILEARDAGLVPITEVGSKDPKRQLSLSVVVEQVRRDIETGAEWVIMEGRECGVNVGIYDDHGGIRPDFFEHLIRDLGDCLGNVIWEAPKKSQQCQLIHRFGVNVNLGNIDATQCLALEALRCGLRFETLQPKAEALLTTTATAIPFVAAQLRGNAS